MVNLMRKKVLVADSIAPAAIDLLRQDADVDVRIGLTPAELLSAIGGYEGLIVRSQTKVTRQIIDAGMKLEVIGRAGVGIDNIDVDAATRRGIFVINSREGNTVSAAEHTMAMLLALVRQIPKADRELRSGVWNRSLRGIEMRNKVMGIIGLGRVGTAVAEIARGFRINLIAYDPMVSQGAADRLGVQMVEMDTLLSKSDFISVHVPLGPATKGLIGHEQIGMMKPTAMIINCARGGVIDEQALYEALEEGHLAGAAVDVFSSEPAIGNILLKSDKVVVTPHLAASTSEAETSAGMDIAEQTVAVLKGRLPRSPVNARAVPAEGMTAVDQYVPGAITLGAIAAQMLKGQAKSIAIRYRGDISKLDTDPIKAAVLSGLLGSLTEERVNIVNMDLVATSRGLRIAEERDPTCENYSSMLTVEIDSVSGKVVVAGSSLRGSVYLVRVNDFWLEIEPSGSYMLFTEHKDRPGVIGAVGSIMGGAGINISQMQVSRGVHRGGKAMMVVCLDDPITSEAHRRIRAIPDMYEVHIVKLARQLSGPST
jgi:D-3-phosphoglycerate dehydrogenase